MELNEFITELATAAQDIGGDGLRMLVRLMALGVAQNTCMLQISDRWLITDLRMSQQAVTEAKKRIRQYVRIASAHGTTTVFTLPLPWLPPQVCLFPAPAGVFHISTGALPGSAGCTGKSAPLHGGAVQGAPSSGAGAPVSGAGCTGIPRTVHGGAVQGAPSSSAPPPPQDDSSRARTESNRIDGLVVIEGVNRLIYRIARIRSIPPPYKAEAEMIRTRLTTFMRANAAHPNSVRPPDDTITAQIQGIAPVGQVLRELDKLQTEGRAVPDTYAYLRTVLINRITGAEADTIRGIFELVKSERNAADGGQMQLGPHGLGDITRLARSIA